MNPWVLAGSAAVVIAAFFFGIHVGAMKGENARNMDRLDAAAVLSKRQAEDIHKDLLYEEQIRAMARQHSKDMAAINASANHPAPRILCHAAGPGGRSTVPGVSSPSADHPNQPGTDSSMPGPEFDPRPALRATGLAAAQSLEVCYAALDQWPAQ